MPPGSEKLQSGPTSPAPSGPSDGSAVPTNHKALGDCRRTTVCGRCGPHLWVQLQSAGEKFVTFSVVGLQADQGEGPGFIAPGDHAGRMGLAYVRSLATQASLGNQETSPGEDYLATDLNIEFRIAPVRVQVKSGHLRRNQDGSYSVRTTMKWREDWATARIPVYLAYVHLERGPALEWLEHSPLCTTFHAHAYWARVNGVSAATVRVQVCNRLTVDTFEDWQRDIEACFGIGSVK